jgi:hypothetical protein
MRTIAAFLLVVTVAGPLPAQSDSARRAWILDTTFYGPPYAFTGREDSLLLARMFEETYNLSMRDVSTDHGPGVLCLAVGRTKTSDPPASVLRVLARHEPQVRPVSACPGRGSWVLTITSLAVGLGDTIIVHSNHYVAPLWAAGWVCRALRIENDWRVFNCSMTWIS